MVEQHFCLRWNNYRTNITAEFEVLREGEHFVDVTLACDGRQLKAHKVVLSACSPYFKDLLQVGSTFMCDSIFCGVAFCVATTFVAVC